MWTRGQAIHRLRRGLSIAAEEWEKEGRSEKSRLIPEEFTLHSRRIGGSTARGASLLVIQREGGWSSRGFMVYVIDTPENLQWVSEVLYGEKEERDSQDRELSRDREGKGKREESRPLVGECWFQSGASGSWRRLKQKARNGGAEIVNQSLLSHPLM